MTIEGQKNNHWLGFYFSVFFSQKSIISSLNPFFIEKFRCPFFLVFQVFLRFLPAVRDLFNGFTELIEKCMQLKYLVNQVLLNCCRKVVFNCEGFTYWEGWNRFSLRRWTEMKLKNVSPKFNEKRATRLQGLMDFHSLLQWRWRKTDFPRENWNPLVSTLQK